jgi:hypothetical protein
MAEQPPLYTPGPDYVELEKTIANLIRVYEQQHPHELIGGIRVTHESGDSPKVAMFTKSV